MSVNAQFLVISGFTSLNASFPSYVADAISNHKSYCNLHGYDYAFRTDSDPELPSFNTTGFYLGANSKPYFIYEAFNRGYEYIFWIDPDSLFTSRKPLHFPDPNLCCLFSSDHSDFANTGHLFFKRCPESFRLLSRWREATKVMFNPSTASFPLTQDGYSLSDQSLFNALLFSDSLEPKLLVSSFNLANNFCENFQRITHNFLYQDPTSFYRIISSSLAYRVKSCDQRVFNSYLFAGLHSGWYQSSDDFIHLVGTDKKWMRLFVANISHIERLHVRLKLLRICRALKSARYYLTLLLR
jgi:hypothetical protein